MRVFFQPSREYTAAAGVVEVAPDSIIARDMSGTTIEAGLTHAVDADGHWYVDTTDALYTTQQKYELLTTTTGSLGVVTEDHPFRHVTPSTSGAAPAAPAIGIPVVTDTTATFPHTDPPANYDHTTITCISLINVVTASGSGTSIEVPGLTPGIHYDAVAVAYNATGVPSAVGAGTIQPFSTLTSTVPTHPFYFKWFLQQETAYHSFGPAVLDAAAAGAYAGQTVDHRVGGGGARGLGKGRDLRWRVECHGAVCPELTQIGFLNWEPESRQPGGDRDKWGT